MAELPLATLVIFFISLAIFLFSVNFPWLIGELGLDVSKLLNQPYRIITFNFVHKSIQLPLNKPLFDIFLDSLHFLGNMFFLFAIGLRVEEKIGPLKFFIVFLFSGIFAAFFLISIQFYLNISLFIIGASGGIFGLLFLAGAMSGREEISLFLMGQKVPLVFLIIFYLLLQIIMFFYNFPKSFGEFGHFGGLLGGFIAFLILT